MKLNEILTGIHLLESYSFNEIFGEKNEKININE